MTDQTNHTHVLLLGGTGTAGRGAAAALVEAGNAVTALVRPGTRPAAMGPGIRQIETDVTNPDALRAALNAAGQIDAVVSCLASRTGAPRDAWAIDYGVHSDLLKACTALGIRQFVLLSAICVQKPDLAFQKAKLAFEAELVASGLTYSIVRPTAFFKSLSGQVDRLRKGKPFLVFGDGTLTACKPISDRDLGRFMASCLTDPQRQNAILPIGGPGGALTARAQGALLFEALGMQPQYREVPVRLLDTIVRVTSALGRVVPRLAEKADLARIGRYYATESMLVLNPETGRYDADATPEFGEDRLADHYARLAKGEVRADLREHAVF